MLEVNKLFVTWLFALFCRAVIGAWTLLENVLE